VEDPGLAVGGGASAHTSTACRNSPRATSKNKSNFAVETELSQKNIVVSHGSKAATSHLTTL
jgi:hypothetical protein